MWEDNLGKFKERRNKNVKPYERPKSLLKRVTDSVTGLLPQPAWLTNLFYSSPKENETESLTNEEQPVPSTSASTEDHRPQVSRKPKMESFIFQRPPGAFVDNVARSSLNAVPSDLIPESNHADVATNLRDTSIQTNGDDDSHSESTSGCSSLLPHPEHRRDNREAELPNVEPLNIDRSSLQMLGNSLSKSLAVDLKNSRGRKTLSLQTFSQSTSIAASPTDEPRFKDSESASISSFYGKSDLSLNCSNNKRDLSQPQTSGFGSKRPRFNITTFGPTAAEARKSVLNESVADSPFYAGRTTYGGASAYRRASLQPVVAASFPYNRKRVQARPLSSTVNASSSVCSNSSSVVMSSSAQRILQALESMSTPVRDAKRIPTNVSNRRSTSFQDEEPSFTGFGLSRRRPNLGPPASKLAIGTPAQVVARPPPVRSTADEVPPVSSTPISAQAGGKMRSRKSAPARQSAREVARIREEEEEPIQVGFQAEPFGLSSLPNFKLLPLPPAVTPSVSLPQSTDKREPQCSMSSKVNGSFMSSQAKSATFTFSAPLVTVSPTVAAVSATIVSAKPSFNFSSPLPIQATPPKAVQKNSKGDLKEVVELKTGSVLDVLGRNSKQEAQSRQETHTTDSVALTSQTITMAKPIELSALHKPPAGSWTCTTCFISNSQDKQACAACEVIRPSPVVVQPTKQTVLTPSLPKEGFGDKFKKQTGQWECSSCLVVNPSKNDKCLSCEEQRPGTIAVSAATPSVSNFKFGVPKKDADASSVIQPPALATKPSTGFQFGATLTGTQDTNDAAKKPAVGFQFGTGLTSGSKTENSSGFIFGAPIEVKNQNREFSSSNHKIPGSTSRKEESQVVGFETPAVSINSDVSSVKASSLLEPVTSVEKKPNAIPSLFTSVTNDFSTRPIFGSGSVLSTTESAFQPSPKPTTTSTESDVKFPLLDFKSSANQSIPAEESRIISTTKSDDTGFPGQNSSLFTAPTKPFSSAAPSLSLPERSTFSFGQPVAEVSKDKLATTVTNQVSTVPVISSTSIGNSFVLPASLPKSDVAAPAPALSMFKPMAPSSFTLGNTSSPFGAPNIPTSSSLNFGAPSSTGIATTGSTFPSSSNSLFSFGSTASSSNSTTSATPTASTFTSSQSAGQPTTLFGFGAPPAYPTGKEALKLNAASGFGFPSSSGIAVTSSSAIAAPSASFSFASSSATPATSTSSISAPPTFSFGAPSTAAPTATTTTSKEALNIPFSFGTQQTQLPSSGSVPTFGTFSSGPPKVSSSAPFSFTGTPAAGVSSSTFGEGASKPAVSFGSLGSLPFVTQSTGMFGAVSSGSFGAAPAVAPSAFTFGAQSAPPPQQPIFNTPSNFGFGTNGGAAPAPAAPSSVFTFGNAAGSNSSSFNFTSFPGTEAASSSFASGLANPFDNTGSGAGGPNRKIRKAVRRR